MVVYKVESGGFFSEPVFCDSLSTARLFAELLSKDDVISIKYDIQPIKVLNKSDYKREIEKG